MLTGPFHRSDADDLAGAYLQRGRPHAIHAIGITRGSGTERKDRRSANRFGGVSPGLHSARSAQHCRGQAGPIGVPCRGRERGASTVQHRDVIGYRERITKLVRDQHHRVSGIGVAANPAQQSRRFQRG